MSSNARTWLTCLAIPLVLWIVLECIARSAEARAAQSPAQSPTSTAARDAGLDAPIQLQHLPGPDARAALEQVHAVLARHALIVVSTQRFASPRALPECYRAVVAECDADADVARIELAGSPAALRAAVEELGAAASGAILVGTEFELGGDFQTLSAKLWLWI